MTRLDEIVHTRRAAVAERKRSVPVDQFRDLAARRDGRRDFALALRTVKRAIIAEFKRASPSAGLLARDADPSVVAQAYERGGAAAISVVTEPAFFDGSLDDLRRARSATKLPVLCKDFIVDEYQLWEAAAAGADAVLLIAAVLDDLHLSLFVQRAALLGLTVVAEVHDETDARRAARARAAIVGVNNRDLRTFEVDVRTALRIRSSIPSRCLTIAESGYCAPEEIALCFSAGFDAVLVGESLMRAPDPAAALRRLCCSAS